MKRNHIEDASHVLENLLGKDDAKKVSDAIDKKIEEAFYFSFEEKKAPLLLRILKFFHKK